MISTIMLVLFYIVVTGLVTVLCQVGYAKWRQAKLKRSASSVTLPLSLLMSMIILWVWLDRGIPAGEGDTISSVNALKIGAICLYAAACIVYIELRSLLSRGYSLRVLVDLLNGGGRMELLQLKDSYGGGMGVQGMLAKRLNSLVALKLLTFHDRSIGPLTWQGRILALIGSGLRRLLRLGTVG